MLEVKVHRQNIPLETSLLFESIVVCLNLFGREEEFVFKQTVVRVVC